MLARLSVIVPYLGDLGLADRAVASVVRQADPIGTETLVIDPTPGRLAASRLSEAFAPQLELGSLRIESVAGPADAPRLRNEGAALAHGGFLAFLEAPDHWLYGRLIELWPLLEGADLILSPSAGYTRSDDWLRDYLRRGTSAVSTCVIRKSLFEAAGGFPAPTSSGAGGEHELWLRCLTLLDRARRSKRFLAIPGHNIVLGRRDARANPRREALGVLRVLPVLPKRYWGTAMGRALKSGLGWQPGPETAKAPSPTP
jgi:hypothetical protein